MDTRYQVPITGRFTIFSGTLAVDPRSQEEAKIKLATNVPSLTNKSMD